MLKSQYDILSHIHGKSIALPIISSLVRISSQKFYFNRNIFPKRQMRILKSVGQKFHEKEIQDYLGDRFYLRLALPRSVRFETVLINKTDSPVLVHAMFKNKCVRIDRKTKTIRCRIINLMADLERIVRADLQPCIFLTMTTTIGKIWSVKGTS